MNIKTIKTIAIAVVAVLLLLLVSSMFVFIGRLGTVVSPGVEDEIIEDTLPSIPVSDFGGTPIYEPKSDQDYEGLLKHNRNVTLSYRDDGFTINTDEAVNQEHYVDLKIHRYSDYFYIDSSSFLTVDFDIDMSEMYDQYRLLTLFRKESGSLAHRNSLYLYLGFDDQSNKYTASLMQDGVLQTVWESKNPVAHLTFVYNLKHDVPSESLVQWYIDGKCVGSATHFLSDEAAFVGAFRVYSYATSDVTDFDKISINNFVVNNFAYGYEGAINYLFNSTEYTLQECSDSILFEG